MVALTAIRETNISFSDSASNNDIVAVFVGATSGIGLATLKAFVAAAKSAEVYIIGRSLEKFSPQLKDLQQSNLSTNVNFIKAEISLIKEVDRVCQEILSKEEKVDILWLSSGVLKFGARDVTQEGLYINLALSYYSRLRFTHNLIAQLKRSDDARVVSILGGGLEKRIDLDDIEVKQDFSAMKAAQTAPTLITLAFKNLSKQHPEITFIHKYPGFVNTGSIANLLSQASGLLSIPANLAKYTLLPVLNASIAMSPIEAGERGLYILNSSNLHSSSQQEQTSTIGAVDSQGKVLLLGPKDDVVEENQVLKQYGEEHAGDKIWAETQAVWERCIADKISN